MVWLLNYWSYKHIFRVSHLVLLCSGSFVIAISVTCPWCGLLCRVKVELFITKATPIVIGIRSTFDLHLRCHCTVSKNPLLFPSSEFT
jgi:hypothetical protein